MAAFSSSSSSLDQRISLERRLPIAALMPASGVRRSCETADSSAVRASLSRTRRDADVADRCSSCRCRMAPACAAKASKSRRWSAARPAGWRTSSWVVSASSWSAVAIGSNAPTEATTSGTPMAGRWMIAAAWTPNMSTARCKSSGIWSVAPSNECDSSTSAADSRCASCASALRAALRCTISATRTPTSTNTTRAMVFSGLATVSVPTGSTKNQLSSSEEMTAATTAGTIPPISATTTVTSRKIGMSRGRLGGVGVGQQQPGEQWGQDERCDRPGPDPAPGQRPWHPPA